MTKKEENITLIEKFEKIEKTENDFTNEVDVEGRRGRRQPKNN